MVEDEGHVAGGDRLEPTATVDAEAGPAEGALRGEEEGMIRWCERTVWG